MAAARKGPWSGGGSSDGELLVGAAERLRWRAPELSLEFARRAAMLAAASRDWACALRANALMVAALVRLGRYAQAVEPAVLALREAESNRQPELVGPLRVDLATSTRAIGLAGGALALLRPMLESGDVRPVVRAGALIEVVGSVAQGERPAEVDDVFAEADRLYAADEGLAADVRRVLRALLCARISGHRRRWGNATGAVAAATEGMTLLDGLSDVGTECGQARAMLSLEMVNALLDSGETAAAVGQAELALAQPIRATSADAVGRLMLAVATRVHLPAGRAQQGRAMLVEVVRVANRHELDELRADVLTSLAHEQELDGALSEALESLRSARAAEQRRLRLETAARSILVEELGAATRLPDDAAAFLRAVVRAPSSASAAQRQQPLVRPQPQPAPAQWPVGEVSRTNLPKPEQSTGPTGDRDEETGLLNRQGLSRRLAAARRQARPTALTLVRLEPSGDHEPEPVPDKSDDPDGTDRFSRDLIRALDRLGRSEIDPDVLNSLAGHVRDMAPERAELVRPEEGELAVLLPDTTRDEAEQFAATLRETVSSSDWAPEDPARGVSVSTGVAQYQEGTTEDALLTAAREALTSSEPEPERDSRLEQPEWQPAEPVYDLPAENYAYIEEYVQRTDPEPAPAPEPEPEPERDSYLDGFPLPDYDDWVRDDAPPAEPPEPKHDAARTTDGGRSILEQLGIASGSGGRRRAPDSFDPYETDQEIDQGKTGETVPSRTVAEILAVTSPSRASIPVTPEPESIPEPPDSPEVPIPPDPDVEPMPRRRRPPPLLPPELPEPIDPITPDIPDVPDVPEVRKDPPRSGLRPSLMRRREKTDVGLADLLAEALVAYQASTVDGSDDDGRPSYEDVEAASSSVGEDTGRHRFPDRASADRDAR